ncbi:MAG: nucleoside-binding protein [Nitrospinota bacterium]|nr:nucleoside-binding protein [Nitrospinota bacterium]
MNKRCELILPYLRLWQRMGGALPVAPILFSLFLVILDSGHASAASWSVNELHYQRGDLLTPSFAGGQKSATDILTFQHASGWEYGDNFYFIDFLRDDKKDGFNDYDFYCELYVNFSLGKIFGVGLAFGPIKDIGLLAGVNAGADANVLKFLPGIRISWDISGFAFLNLDMAAYMEAGPGIASGGALAESDSYYVDINWAYPFHIGSHGFSIEGHAEYIGKRTNELGYDVEGWILAQPQLRYDLGGAFNAQGKVFIGLEWQYWMNKLGDGASDENQVQFLFVWRL